MKAAASGFPGRHRIRAIRARSPKTSGTTSWRSAIPTYGNLVPRDIATREIFDVCVNEGLSVETDRLCVYLDLTHIDRSELDRKLGGILEIYEKFQGVDPRDCPDEDLPRRALQHGRTVGRLRTHRGGRAGTGIAAQPGRRTSRGCTPSANATTSTTAPIGWAPTRC